jgi:hypothetical protein
MEQEKQNIIAWREYLIALSASCLPYAVLFIGASPQGSKWTVPSYAFASGLIYGSFAPGGMRNVLPAALPAIVAPALMVGMAVHGGPTPSGDAGLGIIFALIIIFQQIFSSAVPASIVGAVFARLVRFARS